MKKKGQGLPLNVIIIAVIVLLVLVVLWVIFTVQAGKFNQEVIAKEAELDQDTIADQLKQCDNIPLAKCVVPNGNCFVSDGKCILRPAS